MAVSALGTGRRHERGRLLQSEDDDDLIRAVRHGDDAAFEVIYDRYHRGLLSFCRHLLSSREEGEDALQQTFVSAYRALARDGGQIELRPWLYTIARNRCLSVLRSRRQESVGSPQSVEGRPRRPPFGGMADEVQRRADLRDLLEDVCRLPYQQRAALVLFELGTTPMRKRRGARRAQGQGQGARLPGPRGAVARQARAGNPLRRSGAPATVNGALPRRGMVRGDLDRCRPRGLPPRDRDQRAALAATWRSPRRSA